MEKVVVVSIQLVLHPNARVIGPQISSAFHVDNRVLDLIDEIKPNLTLLWPGETDLMNEI